MIPKLLKDYNFFLDGIGKVGLVDEMTLPTLTILTDEHRGGGMDIPVDLDLGMEKLVLTGVMAEYDADFFRVFGTQDQNAVAGSFLANKVDDTVVEPFELNVRGMMKMIEPAAIQMGQKNTMSFELSLRFYELRMNNEELIVIDADNYVRRINGTDVLAQRRANLGI